MPEQITTYLCKNNSFFTTSVTPEKTARLVEWGNKNEWNQTTKLYVKKNLEKCEYVDMLYSC